MTLQVWVRQTPLRAYAQVFTKGKRTGHRRMPKVSYWQVYARAGESLALSGWKGQGQPRLICLLSIHTWPGGMRNHMVFGNCF